MSPVEHKNLNIVVFRHGEALYKQEEVPLALADDLTQSGIDCVTKNSKQVSDRILASGEIEEVTLISSPFGRTLQTAKIISEELRTRGAKLKSYRNQNIFVSSDLVEQKNFSWDAFKPLVDGGLVECDGKEFFVDSNLTNPDKLSYQSYTTDDIRKIPVEVMSTFPKAYVEKLLRIETSGEVRERAQKIIEIVSRLSQDSRYFILVTHAALISQMVEGREFAPGDFVFLNQR